MLETEPAAGSTSFVHPLNCPSPFGERSTFKAALELAAAELAANVLVTLPASSAPLDTAVVRAFISATAASITGASGFVGSSTGEARHARGAQV